jgi:hypothetical protein
MSYQYCAFGVWADHIFAQANSKQSGKFQASREAISRSLAPTFATPLAGVADPAEPCGRGMVSAGAHLLLKHFSSR